jgi:predicted transcriptional regulator
MDAPGTYCIFRKKLLEGLKPSIKLVYTYLLFYSNHITKQCYPGIRLLAKDMGYDKDTIQNSIKELATKGLIKIQPGKRGQKNIYTIIDPAILPDKVYGNPVQLVNESVRKSSTLITNEHDTEPQKCTESLQKVYGNPVPNQKNITRRKLYNIILTTRDKKPMNEKYSRNYQFEINRRDEEDKLLDESFEEVWREYPKRAGSNNKQAARRQWRARLEEDCTCENMKAGTLRYKVYCDKENKTGSEFVMMASTFFGRDRHFEDEFLLTTNKSTTEISNANIQFNQANTKQTTAQRTDQLARMRRERIGNAIADYREAENTRRISAK